MVAAVTNEVVAYRARNLVNGKSYIGVTKQGLRRREMQHRQAAERGGKWRLHRAIKKYGQDKFVFEVIADFDGDYDLALVYEVEAIAKYKPEYNMSAGGEGKAGPLRPESLISFRAKRAGVPSYRKGIPLSEEHKARLSAANKGQVPWSKGKKMPEAQKQRLREANLGNKHGLGRRRSEVWQGSLNTRALKELFPYLKPTKILTPRAPRIPKPLGPWERTEARLSALAVSIRKAQAANKKPIQCVNDGRVFASANEAAEHYGVKAKLVRQCVRRGQTMRNGLKFIEVLP